MASISTQLEFSVTFSSNFKPTRHCLAEIRFELKHQNIFTSFNSKVSMSANLIESKNVQQESHTVLVIEMAHLISPLLQNKP